MLSITAAKTPEAARKRAIELAEENQSPQFPQVFRQYPNRTLLEVEAAKALIKMHKNSPSVRFAGGKKKSKSPKKSPKNVRSPKKKSPKSMRKSPRKSPKTRRKMNRKLKGGFLGFEYNPFSASPGLSRKLEDTVTQDILTNWSIQCDLATNLYNEIQNNRDNYPGDIKRQN